MAAFQHAEMMTDTGAISRDALQRTVLGMAHFAGTGPQGQTCGGCDYWVVNGKKTICEKYRSLTGDARKNVPSSTSCCRHFVARPKG